MKSRNFFTIPNILTLIRLAFIPLIIITFFVFYDIKPYIPAALYIIATVTDFLDGFIARKYNMVSDYGRVLDPLADKLFINSMLICFVIKENSLIITILLTLNALKESYMIIAGTLLYKRKFIMNSKFIGKAASFALNTGIAAYFFIPYAPVLKIIAEAVLLSGLLLSLSAAVYYTVVVYRQTGGRLPPKNT